LTTLALPPIKLSSLEENLTPLVLLPLADLLLRLGVGEALVGSGTAWASVYAPVPF